MILKKRTLFIYLVFTTVLFFSKEVIYAQTYKINTIFRNDTGFTAELKFSNLSATSNRSLSLNNRGEFVFITNGRVMHYSKGKIKSLANTVHTGPTGGNKFIDIGSTDINDNGIVIFTGVFMVDIETFEVAIFKVAENDEIIPIVSFGDAVQGLESTIVDSHSSSLNNNDEIAFNANLSNGKHGLFLLTDESIQPIILAGDSFPVFTGDETLVFADLPVINDLGEIVFRARFLKGGGSMQNPDDTVSGVFLYREGRIIPVKLPGIEAPGTNGMVFWNAHTSWMTVANSSDVVFRGEYIIPDGDENSFSDRRGSGLFLWSDGETVPLILTGDEAPGVNGNFLFDRGKLSKDSINDFGEVVASFASKYIGGLFLISNDDIIPVVLSKNGNPDPGKRILYTDTAAINNRGDIVFFGEDISGREGVFMAIREE